MIYILTLLGLFSPHNHKIVYLVIAVVRVHIVFAMVAISFPGLSNLPCALCIPSKPPSFLEKQIPHSFELQSKTLHVVKMLVSSVLSFFIIHFKVKVIQNFNLSNFLVSLLALTTILFTLTLLFYRKVLCMVSSRQMIKYRSTLNCLLEMLLFPAVITLKLFLSLLDPVYKILLHVKPQFNFLLVQYFWRLKSQLFFSCLMTVCLFVSHGFLVNLGITKHCSLNCELQYPVYLATAAFLLIISALPCSFFVGLYVVTIIIFGETFDASSRSCTEKPTLFPILHLSFGVLLSYPCARLLELHHPGFLFSMLIRYKG